MHVTSKFLGTNVDWAATRFLLIGCLLGATGCHSTSTAPSGGFASVVISGNTPGQIRDATVEVFSNNGYVVTQKDQGNLVFEKQGSGMSNFAYGNWLDDTPIWVRVKTAIEPVGGMSWRLQCRAYLVRDRARASEEELTVYAIHKGQYQKMLNEVAQRFAKK